MLTVQLFGSPQLTLDGNVVKLTRRKSRALMYYLAARAQSLTRDHLLAFFWPDIPRPAAQQVLRTTLHGLRKSLGSALVVEEDSIALATDAQVDACEFEQNLHHLSSRQSEAQRAKASRLHNAETLRSTSSDDSTDIERLASVLDLYQGDFLADVSLPGAPAFDDWVMVQREHYRRLAMRGLAALSRLHEAAQDYASALASLNRALALDPLQEELQREAMRLLYFSGDRPAAVRRYDQLRRLLDDEMGMPPMAETRALYDAIVNDKLQAAHQPSVRSSGPSRTPDVLQMLPFAGRTAEMQTLRELASRTIWLLALIEGEPGIGKTRLSEEFIRESKMMPLVGVARELEQTLPYQPIIEALRGLLARPEWPATRVALHASLPAIWLNEVGRLLPEVAASPQAVPALADESRLWEGLYRFLTALARQRPLVLFLDDLHWADASTLSLLSYLVRQAASAPIMFLVTARPVPPRSPLGSLLQTLTREGRLERLALTPLTAHDVSAFARHLSASYAYPLADWLMRYSEGNPYLVSELVRHAREKHWLDASGVLNLTAISSLTLVPQTIYSLIQSRLARLSDVARRVLDVAVAAGREFDFDIVARAAALSETAALDALDELLAAGLIQPSSGMAYTFDHTLTMEVVYREAGEPRHRLLHRRVAEALEAAHRERPDSAAGLAGLVAWHYIEGNAPERAAPFAFRAGQLAAHLAAWREAITFYEQALAGADKTLQWPILMALGQARLNAGEHMQASEAFREAARLAQSSGTASQTEVAQLALAQSLLPQARFAEAIVLAQQVRASKDEKNAVSAELIWGTALSLEGADLDGAVEHLRQAESLCVECSDLSNLVHAKFEQGSVLAQQGDLKQAVVLYREALSIAESSGDQTALNWHILAYNNLAYHLHLLGDPSAEGYARDGLALAQEKGMLNTQTYLLSTLGEIALAAGDIDLAEKYFTDGLALAERLSIPERIAGFTANLGRASTQRGETMLAIHRLSTAVTRADMLGTLHLAAQIRLWLAPLLPPSEARARLAEARAIAERGNRRKLLQDIEQVEGKLATQAQG